MTVEPLVRGTAIGELLIDKSTRTHDVKVLEWSSKSRAHGARQIYLADEITISAIDTDERPASNGVEDDVDAALRITLNVRDTLQWGRADVVARKQVIGVSSANRRHELTRREVVDPALTTV
jgi:hypothetical protein